MERHVFYRSELHDKKAVAQGKKVAVSFGARVVRTALGSMLVEASPSTIALVAEALPEWRWCRETMTHRIPEKGRRPRSSK